MYWAARIVQAIRPVKELIFGGEIQRMVREAVVSDQPFAFTSK
jgi:hypothetical protein